MYYDCCKRPHVRGPSLRGCCAGHDLDVPEPVAPFRGIVIAALLAACHGRPCPGGEDSLMISTKRLVPDNYSISDLLLQVSSLIMGEDSLLKRIGTNETKLDSVAETLGNWIVPVSRACNSI